MARILIGNIKGPKGDTGSQGPKGATGPQGPQGPLPPLVNNALTTVAGTGALDAAMGKTLADKDANLQSQITQLNGEIESCILKFNIDLLTLNAGTYYCGSNCQNLPRDGEYCRADVIFLSPNKTEKMIVAYPVGGGVFTRFFVNSSWTTWYA